MDWENKDQAPTESASATAVEAGGKSDKHDKKKHKIRKLCKLVKKDFLKKDFDGFKALVVDADWVCMDCGRASNDPARLHAPIPLEKAEEEVPIA